MSTDETHTDTQNTGAGLAEPADRSREGGAAPGGQDAGQKRQSYYDIELPVTVVLGETELSLAELERWETDTVVNLSAKVSDPLSLTVNGRTVAHGELCEGDAGPGSLAVRILEIVTTDIDR